MSFKVKNAIEFGTVPITLRKNVASEATGLVISDALTISAGGFTVDAGLVAITDNTSLTTAPLIITNSTTGNVWEALRLRGDDGTIGVIADEVYMRFDLSGEDGSAIEEFGRITVQAIAVAEDSEDSVMMFQSIHGGTLTDHTIIGYPVAGQSTPQVKVLSGTTLLPCFSEIGDPNTGLNMLGSGTLDLIAEGIIGLHLATDGGCSVPISLTVDLGGITVSDGASTFTDNAAAATAPLTLINVTATQTSFQALELIGDDTAAGVDDDEVYISFALADDSASPGVRTQTGTLICRATDTAAGSHDGDFLFNLADADTVATRARLTSTGDFILTRDAFTTPTTMALRMVTGTFGNGAVTTVNGSTQLPANSLILGVNTEVTTTYTTTAGLEVGEAGDPNRWGTGILTDGDKLGPADYAATIFYTGAAADVVCADVGANENMVGGACTYVIYYIEMPELGV